MLQHLVSGFAAALTPAYLAYALVGCTLGTLIGVLPGLGPAAGTAILIPLTFKFGPPEFFALMLFGLCLVSGLAGRSMLAALLMTVLGLLLAMIGIDPVRGAPRFAFDIPDLYDGIGFIAVVMGLFGVSEILLAAEAPVGEVVRTRLSSLLPSREEWRRSLGAIGRGTGIGFALGLIPGIGAIVPTFMAYIAEKRLSKTPERFGKGATE